MASHAPPSLDGWSVCFGFDNNSVQYSELCDPESITTDPFTTTPLSEAVLGSPADDMHGKLRNHTVSEAEWHGSPSRSPADRLHGMVADQPVPVLEKAASRRQEQNRLAYAHSSPHGPGRLANCSVDSGSIERHDGICWPV